jgi:uncharacterized protein YjbI with pentapeptide repeats
MANAAHLAIVQQGVAAWNQWRQEHPQVRPDLSRADLSELDLSGADFYHTDLFGANLEGAALAGANLFRANLFRAVLFGADLSGAVLSQCRMGWTIVAGVDLRGVIGLDAIKHDGPSEITISTLYESGGDIPEAFLRGCGVPDSMIDYARSLVVAARPIDYYSVFISYSSRDEALAERLHADLQAAGVRCWYAPEDLKIGDSLIDHIDQAIRLHEKLLILLSASSVASRWVAREVKAALTRELREGRQVLFPIRLDDAVQRSDQGWAAELWAQRKIGDFCGWHDYPTYQTAFARLLRDLTAQADARS